MHHSSGGDAPSSAVKLHFLSGVRTCVELKYSDDSMISINCTVVEDEVANSRFQRSELDWLIYNDPLSYAELILNGDPEKYLRTVTETPQLDFD